MRALVKAQSGPGLVLRDEPVPEIGPDDVLVRIAKTAICGTDVHIWNWDEWASRTIPVPMIIGHEWCGEIAEVGDRRVGPRLQVGQRVSGEGHLVGMRSRMSRAGRFHLDPETRGIGVNVPGAFAEYLRLPAFNAVALPDDIGDDLGAILDPLGNAVHTALSFDLVGEDVLITGAGPIGIMAAVIARHIGARHVVVTDVNAYRLELAAKAADVRPVDVTKEDLRAVMQSLGMTEGLRCRLRDVGRAVGLRADGRAHGDGRAHRHAGDSRRTHRRRLEQDHLQGADHQGRLRPRDVRDLVQDDRHAAVGAEHRPRHHPRLPAERYEEGFDLMRSGQCGKVVLDWGGPT
jgi:threonine 3-dehydrogenase